MYTGNLPHSVVDLYAAFACTRTRRLIEDKVDCKVKETITSLYVQIGLSGNSRESHTVRMCAKTDFRWKRYIFFSRSPLLQEL